MSTRARTSHPRSKSQLSRHAETASVHGFTSFTICSCGNARVWEYDTDSMTGSSYAKCGVCWRVHPFRGAWLDNALGMNFGSWWSQKLAPDFVVR